VVPDESNKPVIVMLATYTDDLIREMAAGRSKAVVHGIFPAPRIEVNWMLTQNFS